jgi:type IV pilus assembly protein PilN
MIQMNLLPWRKALNERKRKENLAVISFAAGFAVCLVILIILGLNMAIANEKRVVQYLNNKISSLDKNLQEIRGLETKKTNLIAKINVLQKLQIRRADTAKIFDELVAAIPDNITLSDVQRTGERVAISGFADSNSDVSQFMKNIERSTLLDSARLLEIEQILINDAFINQFYMDFKIGSI